nr:E3 ubiquitin protein ligase DRIP2-like [Lolium perenne]
MDRCVYYNLTEEDVCRECIMKKIDHEEIASCPVCNVYLGIAPKEKLSCSRFVKDIYLYAFELHRNSIRNTVFPLKTEASGSKDPTITSQAKRKERSLSLHDGITTPIFLPNVYLLSASNSARDILCRECIMKKIDHEEIDSCTVFNVYLGIAPEEKLRLQDKLLPEMPKIYLRIKDRSMQIYSILSYITKKLELASDDKLEILCNEWWSICPSMTLGCLLEQWLSSKLKQKVRATVGGPAKDFVMELSYRRRPAALSAA